MLRRDTPLVVALGTGRTMRAAIDELSLMVCDHHRIVSLNGTIGRDGAATSHDVIMRIAEMVQAPHYPMPVPVICDSAEERAEFHALRPVRCVAELARDADETFVGVGHMGADAPLRADGLITEAELAQLMSQDAAGEIAGWVFDGAGQYLDLPHNARVGGVRVTAKSSAGAHKGVQSCRHSLLPSSCEHMLINWANAQPSTRFCQVILGQSVVNSVLT